MSPFSRYFHQLRMAHGIRQVELAALMGYKQSYISALEVGKKGPQLQISSSAYSNIHQLRLDFKCAETRLWEVL